jgi:hypothetical protein
MTNSRTPGSDPARPRLGWCLSASTTATMRVANRSAADGLSAAMKARISRSRANARGDQTISSFGAIRKCSSSGDSGVTPPRHRGACRIHTWAAEAPGRCPRTTATPSCLHCVRSAPTPLDDPLGGFLLVIAPGQRDTIPRHPRSGSSHSGLTPSPASPAVS